MYVAASLGKKSNISLSRIIVCTTLKCCITGLPLRAGLIHRHMSICYVFKVCRKHSQNRRVLKVSDTVEICKIGTTTNTYIYIVFVIYLETIICVETS